MKTLNVVLTVALIIVTCFYFIDTSKHRADNERNKEIIETNQAIVDSLLKENVAIENEVDSLQGVALSLKGSLQLYKDSIIKISKDYDVTYNEVYNLSDSASYKFFIKYLSKRK